MIILDKKNSRWLSIGVMSIVLLLLAVLILRERQQQIVEVRDEISDSGNVDIRILSQGMNMAPAALSADYQLPPAAIIIDDYVFRSAGNRKGLHVATLGPDFVLADRRWFDLAESVKDGDVFCQYVSMQPINTTLLIGTYGDLQLKEGKTLVLRERLEKTFATLGAKALPFNHSGASWALVTLLRPEGWVNLTESHSQLSGVFAAFTIQPNLSIYDDYDGDFVDDKTHLLRKKVLREERDILRQTISNSTGVFTPNPQLYKGRVISNEPVQTGTYFFFVAGHAYGKPNPRHKTIGLYHPLKNYLHSTEQGANLELGVLTGDIVRSATTKAWDAVDDDIKALGIPVYFAVGNHDVGRGKSAKRKLFEERYGATFYQFIFRNDLFIVLDPNIDYWNISGEQLDFLKQSVSDTDHVNNIFVFFHQVLWWDSANRFHKVRFNSDSGRGEVINFWTDIEPLFHGLKNNVYMFAGDVCAVRNSKPHYFNYDNISLIASGMGSGENDNLLVVGVGSDSAVNVQLVGIKGLVGKLGDYAVPNNPVPVGGVPLHNITHTDTLCSPILYLPLDDNAGDPMVRDVAEGRYEIAFLDPSGDPNTGAHSTQGIVGRALTFDGVDDALDIDGLSVPIDQDCAISLWYRLDALPSEKLRAFGNYRWETSGVFLRQHPSGLLRWNIMYSGSKYEGFAHTVTIGDWNHFVCQRNGGVIEFFVNGNLAGTYSGNPVQLLNGKEFCIGVNVYEGNVVFSMDDFRVYDRALLESEIEALAASSQ